MRTAMASILAGGALVGLLLTANPGAAQPSPDDESADTESPDESADTGSADTESPEDETADAENPDTQGDDPHRDRTGSSVVDRAEQANTPVELPGKTYYFVGARYRATVVPKFMIGLFGDGGRTVVVHGGGPEFGIRKDGFEISPSVWLASYHMDDTAFKAKDDAVDAYEIVESQIKVLYLTSDFLWSSDISPEFAINYGLGAGFGFVFGKLYRTQAYSPQGPNADPETFAKCSEPGDPRDANGWCGDDNDHYNGYTEPSWANGGSKPLIFPWLAVQTGVRIKPHRNFAARIDLGFGTSGFFVGLGADYGI
jgi:hypothetical protein